MPSQITCPGCKQPLEAAEFLSACSGWFAAVDCVQFTCPRCRSPGEARLETGRISHGYVYAAGSPHFAAMLSEPVPALVVAQTPDGLSVTLDSASRTLPRS
jgi:hypothetical protein